MQTDRGVVGAGLRAALVVIVFTSSWTFAADANEPALQRTWTASDVDPTADTGLRPGARPVTFRGFVLDIGELQEQLATAPQEAVAAAQGAETVLSLPMPDGTFARFAVVESSIMEPPLQAKYPEIRTYAGQGIDDPSASLRCDTTPQGFHAQILSPRGAVYIDPYWIGPTTYYSVSNKRDARPGQERWSCLTPADDAAANVAGLGTVAAWDGNLRTYRLACAATGEYTAFHGGTVVLGLAAVTTAVNRVSGVYETELGVRMVLVANNNLLIYTNGAIDPYTNADGETMLDENQFNLDTVIGSGNYDIGHVFSTGGGGIAGLRVVCRSNSKALGVTGRGSPTGDAFYIDYVAHEMGHQFGGNHTFNGTRGSCSGNGNNGTAYEPGSGSTIMAYAGICGLDDLQAHSDPFFHFASLDEIHAYTTTSFGNTCPVQTATGNGAPTVDAGGDFTIPAQTPFELTAVGDDPDGDPLTFCWEERDLGPAAVLNAPDDGQIPLFRSFSPSSASTRTFPRLPNLLANVSSQSEKLPTTSRIMDFRVTVRDSLAGGGAFAEDDMRITVSASAGPFQVTYPNSAVSLFSATSVTWAVAGTDLPPVSTPNVNIWLSTDGGFTYPYVLAADTPNDGSQIVALPEVYSTTARMRVEGAGNIFFDVSDVNFLIVGCTNATAPQPDPSGTPRNRYLSFIPGVSGVSTAVRVTLSDLPPPFTAHNGEVRWLGAPQTISFSGGPATIAPLQCEPHFRDWGAVGLVHAYGVEVVPAATYDVQVLQCDTAVVAGATSLSVNTSRWGDVIEPFHSLLDPDQPDARDIVAMVDRFRGTPTAPIIPSADLYPNVPNQIIDALDISSTVDAFRHLTYPFSGPGSCTP